MSVIGRVYYEITNTTDVICSRIFINIKTGYGYYNLLSPLIFWDNKAKVIVQNQLGCCLLLSYTGKLIGTIIYGEKMQVLYMYACSVIKSP